MKKNYYAIRKGQKTGIFTSWAEAEPLVKGYKGASYKGFATREEAEAYLEGDEGSVAREGITDIEDWDEISAPYAYTDGSYNSSTGVYGYGVYMVANGEEYELMGKGDDPEEAKSRNVAGELHGVMAAVDEARELGLKELTICYDYEGIEYWVTMEWKANKPLTKAYQEFMWAAGIEFHFRHVKAHSGIPGNEKVDALAKQAVGIEA